MTATPPSSAVRICARAFRLIEHKGRLVAFDDGTPMAEDAVLHYPPALRECLEAVDWIFASKTFTTPARADLSAVAGSTAFQIDPTVIRVREVHGPAAQAWKVEGGVIRAPDPGPLVYRATTLVEDPTLFSPGFGTALTYLIAHYLAPVWTTSSNRSEKLWGSFQDAIAAAMATDAHEAAPSSWLDDARPGYAESMGGYSGVCR